MCRGETVLHLGAPAPQQAAQREAGEDDDGGDRQRRQHELPVEQREEDRGAGEKEHLPHEFGDLVPHDLLQRRAVGGQPRGEFAARPACMKSRRESDEPGEEFVTQLRHDPLARRAEPVRLAEVEHALESEEAEESERDRAEERSVAVAEGGVHQVADDEGEGEPDRRAQEEADAGAGEGGPVRPQPRGQPLQREQRNP